MARLLLSSASMDTATIAFGPGGVTPFVKRLATPNGGSPMIRTLLRSTMTCAALSLLFAGAGARAQTAGETEGNRMEKKGNAEEKAADAEKVKGATMEKKGKAEETAGKKSGNKSEEMAGTRKKTKGHAVEKAGEARGDEAAQMEKSGNQSEKAGVKAKKTAENVDKK